MASLSLYFDSSNIEIAHGYTPRGFLLQKGDPKKPWRPKKGEALILRKIGEDGPFLEIGRYLVKDQTASSPVSSHNYTVEADPISLILRGEIYATKITLPRPSTIETLQEQVREFVENSNPEEKKQALTRVQDFLNYLNMLEQELGKDS